MPYRSIEAPLHLGRACSTKISDKCGRKPSSQEFMQVLAAALLALQIMRLINVRTFKLEQFFGRGIPKYAILSHTWGPEEISFQEFAKEESRAKSGYIKIQKFIECIKKEEPVLDWAWVDTCCINKESSAELSEAINSMYKWYADAAVCHAYFDDVYPNLNRYHLIPDASFQNSRWFTRGWTLQELLAPTCVKCFARDWSFIGDRDSLVDQISRATGIQEVYLRTHQGNRLDYLRRASAVQKINWASTRETTREEDIAYCLLGLLDVNMSLRYGEGGTKAFQRLQKKIYDPSILAWNTLSEEQLATRSRARCSWEKFSTSKLKEPHSPISAAIMMLLGHCHPWVDPADKELTEMVHPVGLLATSPKAFQHCSGIITEPIDLEWKTNGNRISIILPTSDDAHPHVVLPCRLGNGQQNFIAVPLTSYGNQCFYRAGPWKVVDSGAWHRWPRRQLLLSLTDPIIPQLPAENREVVAISLIDPRIRVIQVYPLEYWVSPDTIEWSVISEAKFRAGVVFSLLIELPDNGGTFAILISRARPITPQPKFFTFMNPTGLYCRVDPTRRDTRPFSVEFSLEEWTRSQPHWVLQRPNTREVLINLTQRSSSRPQELQINVRGPTTATSENPALRRMKWCLCRIALRGVRSIPHLLGLPHLGLRLRWINLGLRVEQGRQGTDLGVQEVLYLYIGRGQPCVEVPWRNYTLLLLRLAEVGCYGALVASVAVTIVRIYSKAIEYYPKQWEANWEWRKSVNDSIVPFIDWTYMSYRLLPVSTYFVPGSSAVLRRYRLLISLILGGSLVQAVDHTKLEVVWPNSFPIIVVIICTPSFGFYLGTRQTNWRKDYRSLVFHWYITVTMKGYGWWNGLTPAMSRLGHSVPILYSSEFIMSRNPFDHDMSFQLFGLGFLSGIVIILSLKFL